MSSVPFLRFIPLGVSRPDRIVAPWLGFQRSVRHQAFDANLDQDQLAEARKWHQSFQLTSIPAGSTSFSRSSGPGGQHVNKFVSPQVPVSFFDLCLLTTLPRTESKATTTWPTSQLLSILPKYLHARLRSSKYYVERNDAISIQAQTHRSRTANTDENRQKLFDEIEKLYRGAVPNETDPEKTRKHEAS